MTVPRFPRPQTLDLCLKKDCAPLQFAPPARYRTTCLVETIMSRQQQTIEHLFGAALDLLPEQRAAFLDEACRDAPRLRSRVEDLLLVNERLGSFLDQPLLGPRAAAADAAPAGMLEPPADLRAGEPSLLKHCFFAPDELINRRFRIVRFIARGGMGEIYEVEDCFLQGVHVALKIILPQVAVTEGATHRFEQEVLLARKVIHPNLCPIYDIARSGESSSPFLFLTMKLLSGETLADRLKRPGSISDDEALSILRQLCAGLDALHTAGIIHRDIKPTNVMVDGSGSALQLWIMDFGLARSYASELTRDNSGVLAGTPGYLAPELLRGDRPSQASDVFALGVLLHMVVSDQGLDETGSFQTVPVSAHQHSTLSPLLQRAVRDFRSEDPEVRCTAFRQILQGLLTPSSFPGKALVSLPSPPRSKPLTRRGFAIGAALSAAGIAAAAFFEADRLRDLLHPLPRKRFVALLKWPTASDQKLRLVISDVIDVIGRELSRVEAFDRDLLVISESASSQMESPAELSSIRDSFGANLVLAASGRVEAEHLYLTLQVLDTSLKRPLRERLLRVASDDQTSLSARAVQASADLLGIQQYRQDKDLAGRGTDRPDAYAAFLAGESLRKKNTAAALEEAFPHYKEALTLDPHYTLAMASLARAYLRSYGLHADPAALVLARENCEAALALNPSLVDAHQVLARVYEFLGDRQTASRELKTALALDPGDPNTLLSQARLFEESGQFDEAISRYTRVLRLRPNYWLAHQELGIVLYNSGNLSQALIELRAASLAAPKNSLAANNIGSLLLQEGKLTEAEKYLERSLSLEENDLAAANLATLYRLRSRLPEALAYARKAVSLNPQEPHYLLELADTLSASYLREQSLTVYKEAVERCSEELHTEVANGPLWMLLALLRVKAGDGTASAALIAKAEQFSASDLDSQLLKVRVLELLGHRSEALDVLSRVLDRGATIFQAQTLPDLDSLRSDPRYRGLIESRTNKAKAGNLAAL